MLDPKIFESTQKSWLLYTSPHIKTLFYVYIFFFILLFFCQSLSLVNSYFLLVVVPLAILPVEFSGVLTIGSINLPRLRFCLVAPLQTLESINSPIFIGAILFGMCIVTSTTVSPYTSLGWFFVTSSWLISISLFLLITARLARYYNDFYSEFLFMLTVISALNGLINLIIYLNTIPIELDITDVRFKPQFGLVPDNFHTTGAMAYATCLVSAVGALLHNKINKRKPIIIISIMLYLVLLIISQSRGPLIGALLVIFVSSFMSNTEQYSKLLLYFPPLSLIIFFMIPRIGSWALERGSNHRFELWTRFLGLVGQRFLLGYGERIVFSVEISDGEFLGHAHSIYIDSWLRGGIGAFVASISTYLYALIKTLSYAIKFNNPTPVSLMLLFLIVGLFDFDLMIFEADWQWVCFWLPLGLAIACDRKLADCFYK